MPRVLNGRPLESIADSEIGDPKFTRDFGRAHHATGAAIAEPPGYENAIGAIKQLFSSGLLECFRFNPADIHAQSVLESTVIQSLVQALVRVLVTDVFADDMDGD